MEYWQKNPMIFFSVKLKARKIFWSNKNDFIHMKNNHPNTQWIWHFLIRLTIIPFFLNNLFVLFIYYSFQSNLYGATLCSGAIESCFCFYHKFEFFYIFLLFHKKNKNMKFSVATLQYFHLFQWDLHILFTTY